MTENGIDILREGVAVSDTFESEVTYRGNPGAGLVVVLEGFPYQGPRRLIGRSVRIVTESGQESTATIDDAKDHIATISLFFRNLGRVNVPIGAKVYLAD